MSKRFPGKEQPETLQEAKDLLELGIQGKPLEEQLEYVFSFAGFFEEAYLGKHYGMDTQFFGERNNVYTFIENKKSEEIYSSKIQVIQQKIKKLSSVKDKIYYLNAFHDDIMTQVKANPDVNEGFRNAELGKSFRFPGPSWVKRAMDKTDQPPFDGAILRGEGVAFSRIKRYISEQIEEITSTPNEKEKINDGETNGNISLESYLTDDSKKLVPFLAANFARKKPRFIAYLLFALIELQYMESSVLYENLTQLVLAINISFKTHFSRKSIGYHRENRGSKDPSMRKEINAISDTIKAEFEKSESSNL